VMWTLAALALAASPRRSLAAATGSAACFAMAVLKLPRVRGHLNAYERRARDGSSRATYPSAVPAGVPG
jgi:hypothetical protein